MNYFQTDTLTIYNGDALKVLKTLQSESVHCVVTSPPYWGLRDYGIEGQLGIEPTIKEHIESLVAVFREVRRVLRNDGVCWINYGDAYAGSGKGINADGTKGVYRGIQTSNKGSMNLLTKKVKTDLTPQCLMGLPWRLALALIDDGWILRQDIIWYKPNPMPESVKTRCTKAHEYIFLFTKSIEYYFEQLLDLRSSYDYNPPRGSKGCNMPHKARRDKGDNKTFRGGKYVNNNAFNNSEQIKKTSVGQKGENSPFRNKHSVWVVSAESGTPPWWLGDSEHYARFPAKLIEPCIRAGCPEGGVVLDLFFGSGTTGEVALNQYKKCIGIELNPAYCEMAKRRLQDPIAVLIENK